MKSYLKILTLSLTLIVSAVLIPKQGKAQQENVNFQIFYDQLSPYGQWVDYSNYGYVWIPDVGADFAPYSTAGHWILTDYGWTWVSDYEWGWAPFHYGRWNFDNSYGWFWIPDNQWGPAWVTWRSADGYYGWEPMEYGISVNLSFGRSYNRQNDHWTFVRNQDIERSDISHYYTNQNDRDRIIVNSTIINHTYIDNSRNTTYVSGPAREDVQRVTGRTLKSVAVQENDRPGQSMINGQLRIYRPQVNKNANSAQRPAPTKIMDIKDVKRPSERGQGNQQRTANPVDNNKPDRQQGNENQQNNFNRPAVPQNGTPTTIDRRLQQPGNAIPQNNNNRPDMPQNQIPAGNDRKIQQPVNTTPQNIQEPKPVAPQNTIPSVNDRRQPPQRTVTPESNNNQRPTVPENATPAVIDRKQQQKPATVNPPNNNNARPAQQQRVLPAGSNKRGPQSKTAKTVSKKRDQTVEKPSPDSQK